MDKSNLDSEFGHLLPHPAGKSKLKRHIWAGWQKGVAVSVTCSVVALIFNITLLVWASSKPLSGSGTHILAQGSRSQINTISLIAHLGINILSTIILAGSNYTLQVLTAPTRDAIDRAHGKKKHVNIGITSLRGWHNLSKRRIFLYLSLLVIMLPIHLVYNSIIVSTTAAIGVSDASALVTNDFLQHLPTKLSLVSLWEEATTGQLVNLSSSDCLKYFNEASYLTEHDRPISYEYSDVLIFSNISSAQLNATLAAVPSIASSGNFLGWTNSTEHTLPAEFTWTHGEWGMNPNRLPEGTYVSGLLDNFNSTMSQKFNITLHIRGALFGNIPAEAEYCLARYSDSSFLELVPHLLVTVVVCNILKITILLITLRMDFSPLVTIGDAISSFLDRPDPTTKSFGPVSTHDVTWCKTFRRLRHQRRWKALRQRYFHSASFWRWFIPFSILLLFWIFDIIVFGMRSPTRSDIITSWNDAIKHDPRSFTATNMSLYSTVIIINLPQLGLSIMYVWYNSLITCLQISAEFSSYSKMKKGLRVSKPEGEQRETYFLSLPYRYSVPLAIVSMLLHWIVSQTLYLVRIVGYHPDGTRNDRYNANGIASSLLAMLVNIALGGVFMIFLIGYGFRRYGSGSPIVDSNSIAISASCHPDASEGRISSKKLQYGVLESGRVGFSTKDVRPLRQGEFY